MAVIGQAIITAAGLNKILQAQTSGVTIKPKYYKVTANDMALDPWITDITNPWRTADINEYSIVNANTVQFVVDILPQDAINYGRTFGLYLDDGTLFLIAKPPAPFPPQMRQLFKIQVQYQNIANTLDFEYIPRDQEEQDLALLQTSMAFSAAIFDLRNQLGLTNNRVEEVYKEVVRLHNQADAHNHDPYAHPEIQHRLDLSDRFINLSLLQNSMDFGSLICDIRQTLSSVQYNQFNTFQDIESIKNDINTYAKQRTLYVKQFNGTAELPRLTSGTLPDTPLFTFNFDKYNDGSLLLVNMNFTSWTGNGYLRSAKVDLSYDSFTIPDIQGFRCIGTGAYGIDLLGKTALFMRKVPKGSYQLKVFLWEGDRSIDTGNTDPGYGSVKIEVYEIL